MDARVVQDEQARWLADALASVKRSGFFMKKAMDDNNLPEALRYAAALLGELRTSLLAPPTYFELYLKATDELAVLAGWFAGEPARGRTLPALYARVQAAGNVLPRLYLMAAVGGVCAAAGALPARDVLADLADMARGVQHPLRGLFLRAYICQIARDVLPGCGGGGSGGAATAAAAAASSNGGGASSCSPSPSTTTTTRAAADFLLANFAEANKLWVRMALQAGGGGGAGGGAPDTTAAAPPPPGPSAASRARRDRERGQLADLVGKNLHLLARLEGLDLPLYSSHVLPSVLAQLVGCRDALAQTYLAQCVVQAFPDEWHAASLPALLGAFGDLAPGAGLAAAFGGLADRLAAATLASSSSSSSADPAVAALRGRPTFDALAAAAAGAVAKQPDLPPAEVAALFGGLARFATEVHTPAAGAAAGASSSSSSSSSIPAALDTVDAALSGCAAALAERGGLVAGDGAGVRAVVGLLADPLDAAAAAGRDITPLLALPSFPALAAVLPGPARREVAAKVARAVVARAEPVDGPAAARVVLSFLRPLLTDEEGGGGGNGGGEPTPAAEVEEECALVARLIHRLALPDRPADHFAALTAARDAAGAGGPARLAALLPPLAFGGLAVARAAAAGGHVGDDRRASGDGVEDILLTGGKAKAVKKASAAKAAETSTTTTTAADALRFVGDVASTLADAGASPQAALALFLASATTAADVGLELVAYDGFERAFTLYEDGIPGSAAQRSALGALTGALAAASPRLGPDSRSALAGKVAGYASTLLRKADQCVALCACAFLHWQGGEGGSGGGGDGDGEAAVACLRRALKAAASAGAQQAAAAAAGGGGPASSSSSSAPDPAALPSTPAALYTAVLDAVLRLAAAGCTAVSGDMVGNLVELVGNEVGGAGASKTGAAAKPYYDAVAAYGRRLAGVDKVGVLAGVQF